MDLDPTSLLPTLGPYGVVLLLTMWIARAIKTGQWVPRRTHEDTRQERDVWRETARTQQAERQELTAQLAALTTAVHQLVAAQSSPVPYWPPYPPPNGTGRHRGAA